jgi:hypothetical protein
MMNPWYIENMAEYQRQQIRAEFEQIHLEDRIVQSRAYRPRFFERSMFHFANWMIATGKQLRKRYEVPAVKCSQSTSSFAH